MEITDKTNSEEKEELEASLPNPPEEPIEEAPAKLNFFPLEILSTISIAQNQNGLRRKDYKRYHNYCSRKIHSLRKANKFSQGTNNRYIPLKLTESNLSTTNQLLIEVFSAERYWTNGMYLKQLNMQSMMDTHRCIRHSKKKFLQADKTAYNLFLLVNNSPLELKSKLEAEAYALSIRGQSLIENQKDLGEALKVLFRACALYDKIASTKDQMEAIMYKEKVQQIEPFLKFCFHGLGIQSQDELKVKEMRAEVEEELGRLFKELDLQLRNERMSGLGALGARFSDVSLEGKVVGIKSEELRQMFRDVAVMIEEVKDSKLQEKDKKLGIYTKLFAKFDQCTDLIKKERSEEYMKSEGSGEIYSSLLNHIQTTRNELMIDKNILLTKEHMDKINNSTEIEQILVKNQKSKSRGASILIKLFGNIIKRLIQTSNIEKDSGSGIKMQTLELQQSIYKTLQLFYHGINHIYQLKLKEASLILEKVYDEIGQIVEYYAQNTQITSDLLTVFVQDLKNMIPRIESIQLMVFSRIVFLNELQQTKQNEASQINTDVRADSNENNNIKMEKKKYKNVCLNDIRKWNNIDFEFVKNANTMNLNLKESDDVLFVPQSKLDNRPKLTQFLNSEASLESWKFVHLVPSVNPVHVEPAQFDIASQLLKFPDVLSFAKEERDKKKSFFKKAFSKLFTKK